MIRYHTPISISNKNQLLITHINEIVMKLMKMIYTPPCFPSGKFGQHVVIPKLWIGKIQTIGGGIHEIQRKERA